MLDKKGTIVNLTHTVTVTTSINLDRMPVSIKETLTWLIKPHTHKEGGVQNVFVKPDEVLSLILAKVFEGSARDSGAIKAINGENTWAEVTINPVIDEDLIKTAFLNEKVKQTQASR